MKSITFLAGVALCLLFFTNCNEKGTTDSKAAATGQIPTNLGGYWVNDTWWQELKSSKSPKQASAKLQGISTAIFRQNGSNWIADLGYNWHEGQQLTLREKDGGLQLYDTQNAAVAAIPLVPQSDGSIQLQSVPMVRLADGFDGSKVIAHEVLGGQYDLNGKTVVFNPNGKVVGLEGYGYYEMLLDYITDELGTDQLTLSKDGSSPQKFAFKVENGHLVLSEIVDEGGKETFQYKVGAVKFDLTKK